MRWVLKSMVHRYFDAITEKEKPWPIQGLMICYQ
jgi:hypothetical protein